VQHRGKYYEEDVCLLKISKMGGVRYIFRKRMRRSTNIPVRIALPANGAAMTAVTGAEIKTVVV